MNVSTWIIKRYVNVLHDADTPDVPVGVARALVGLAPAAPPDDEPENDHDLVIFMSLLIQTNPTQIYQNQDK